MKPILTALLLLAATVSSMNASDLKETFKAGDKLRLQTVQPLADNPSEVTIVQTGADSWVLVEYIRSFSKPGESGLKTEPVQAWVNFDHVIAAKKVTAAK